MSGFDPAKFLDWIDDQGDVVHRETLIEEFPDFPFERLRGVTGPIINDKRAYYVYDLERAARGKQPRD